MKAIANLFLSSILLILPFVQAQAEDEKLTVETIFGMCEVDHPLVAQLLEAPVMKRLQHVDQSGTTRYYTNVPPFSRYSHSVGVYALLQKTGVSFEEQVAGLLHDASHTVFSHVGDMLFTPSARGEAYQDTIHEWFLKRMHVQEMIEPYKMRVHDILPKSDNFKALEQNLPSMCADRIEYNLHTGLIFDMITREKIAQIVADLHFENGRWYFTDPHLAKKLGMLSLYFTEHFWGSTENYVVYHWSSEALKRAVERNEVTVEDIHFGTDRDVLKKLEESQDPTIQVLIHQCKHSDQYYEVVTGDEYDHLLQPKFRGIDPLVHFSSKLVHLSTIDNQFYKEYHRVKDLVTNGIKVRFTKSALHFAKKTTTQKSRV